MTTVAWKDGVVAADTQATSEYGAITGHFVKIELLENGSILAMLGDACTAYPLRDWFLGDRDKDQPGKGMIVVFKRDGRHLLYNDGGWQILAPAAFRAFGSGGELALGAMAAGASAKEAVEIAIRLNVHTGGEVTVLGLRP